MQPIIICGAGKYGIFAYWHLFQEVSFKYFVDPKDVANPDVLQTGLSIHNFNYLQQEDRETEIIVAIENNSERENAVESLLELGFQNVYTYMPPEHITKDYCSKLEEYRYTDVINELRENHSICLGKFLQDCIRDWQSIPLKEMVLLCWGDSMPLDYAFIYAIARKYNCRKYLEIGSYIGESINILTDICDELHSVTAAPGSENSMRSWCIENNIPDYSDRLTYSPKIIHHHCDDSKAFDFNTIPRDIDLYFIDGDHSFSGVYFDTKNVFEHRKKDSIVIWHDFKSIIYPKTAVRVAAAAKMAIGEEEFKNVFCVDTNICGIYLPPELQKDFSLRDYKYTDEPQKLYCYDLNLNIVER